MPPKAKATSAASTGAGNTTSTGAAGTPAEAPKKKATKKIVALPLTDAQKTAQAALEEANKAAREELVKNSGPKLEAAQSKVTKAREAYDTARSELKELNQILGLQPAAKSKANGVGNHFVFVKDFPADGKAGKGQMGQILQIIKAAGKDGINRAKLVETMSKTITSTMDYSKLLSFYQRKLRDDGYVLISSVEVPAEKAA